MNNLPLPRSNGYDDYKSVHEPMNSRAFFRLSIVLLAMLAGSSGYAQVYKWVDERGVTNYAGEPPADPKVKAKTKVVEDTMSVYTPPTSVTEAVATSRARRNDPLAEKVDNLERQLDAERRARQHAATAAAEAQAATAESARNVIGGTWYPPGAFVVPRVRNRTIPQAQLTPGTTAGNVVGPNGYIPGNSAGAARLAPPPRPRRPPELLR